MTDTTSVRPDETRSNQAAGPSPRPWDGSPFPTISYHEFGVRRPALSYFGMFDAMLSDAPAFRLDVAPGQQLGWVLTGMDRVRGAYQTHETFSNVAVIPSSPEPTYKFIPEMTDPPEHTDWRRLLGATFGPKATDRMEPWVRERAVSLIDGLVDAGSCDAVKDFALKFPNSVFLDILGLPQSELPFFLTSVEKITHGNHADPQDVRIQAETMIEVKEYFAELITQRRRSPRTDLLSEVVGYEMNGTPVSDDDLTSLLLFLFVAGLDTVAIAFTYALLHFATHRADQDRARHDRSSVPAYVEETLRVYSFVTPARKVAHDVDFHGCPMKTGEMVYLPVGLANRDPEYFPNPGLVDPDRERGAHIAFGAGPHRCLGSHLARRELHIALDEWHQRIPPFALDESIQLTERGQQIGPDTLPLYWPA